MPRTKTSSRRPRVARATAQPADPRQPIDPCTITLEELVAALTARGIVLHVNATALEWEAPPDMMTPEIYCAIIRFHQRLVALLRPPRSMQSNDIGNRSRWPAIDPLKITFTELWNTLMERGIGFTLTSGDGDLQWIDRHGAMTLDLASAVERYRRTLIEALGPSRLPRYDPPESSEPTTRNS